MLLANRSPGLPFMRTALIGRQQELAIARDLLLIESVPLLTLTGTGGVGKTRLALAIAHDVADAFTGGAVFVDLAPIRDPAQVLPAIAQTLGIRETGNRPLADILTSFLHPRQHLILLDNLEHLLDAAPHIAELLAACPALQVLATSRARLHLRGEHEFPVDPLLLPADTAAPVETLVQADAVALFMQRGRAIDPGLISSDDDVRAVAECCRRLDGLPLAIELAVTRLKVFTPSGLAAQLSNSLQLLSEGARDLPERQRALRDAIAWSYDLLTPGEQRLFERLAVFAGGFDLEAATAIDCEEPLQVAHWIMGLVDQNLLRRIDRLYADSEGGARFGMLETVRAFARERLQDRVDASAVQQAHARYFLTLVEQAEAEMYGPRMGWWLDRLEGEHANIRAALDTFAEANDSISELTLGASLVEFWWERGHLREGIHRLEGVLERSSAAPLRLRAKAAIVLAGQYGSTGNTARALELTASGLTWARAAGDDDLIALGLWTRALNLLKMEQEDHLAAAIALLEEAVALLEDREPAPWVRSYAIGELGNAIARRGDRTRGVALIEQALAIDRARCEPFGTGVHLAALGDWSRQAGDAASAAALYGDSVRALWELRDVMTIGWPIECLAALGIECGFFAESARLLGAVAAISERTGVPFLNPALAEPRDDTVAIATAVGRDRPLAENVADALALADQLVQNPYVREPSASWPPIPPANIVTDPFGLSKRERQVLSLVAQRQTDAEIAEALFISYRTVTTHVTAIFNKLGVSNRRDAAAIAARFGLV